jgi:hypothetical protein
MDLASCIVFPLLPAAVFMSSIHTFLGLPLPLLLVVLVSKIVRFTLYFAWLAVGGKVPSVFCTRGTEEYN